MASIFVIEDEKLILEDIVLILELNGYEAAGAALPAEGIQEVLKSPPDLILCDISMPGMKGYEVLRILRDQLGDAMPPFVFCTAMTSDEAVAEGYSLGANDYLKKPFSEDQLMTIVKKFLP